MISSSIGHFCSTAAFVITCTPSFEKKNNNASAMASSIQTAFYALALLVCGSLSTLTMKNLGNEMDQMEVDDAILVCLCGML